MPQNQMPRAMGKGDPSIAWPSQSPIRKEPKTITRLLRADAAPAA